MFHPIVLLVLILRALPASPLEDVLSAPALICPVDPLGSSQDPDPIEPEETRIVAAGGGDRG